MTNKIVLIDADQTKTKTHKEANMQRCKVQKIHAFVHNIQVNITRHTCTFIYKTKEEECLIMIKNKHVLNKTGLCWGGKGWVVDGKEPKGGNDVV